MQDLFNTPRLDPASAAVPASTLQPIAPDFHPLFGDRLAVFPRSLAYSAPPALGYWPDLATFLEDARTRQMLYCPCRPSPYSLLVVFHKPTRSWETLKFKDAELVGHSRGSTFAEAMANALLLGPQPDEP